MNRYDFLKPMIEYQLTVRGVEPATFADAVIAAKQRIAEAHEERDAIAVRAAAAAYGGIVKRWRRWLIVQLTEASLRHCEKSRQSVRAWQQENFGQAVASAWLDQYASPERSGGGRIEHRPHGIDGAARAFYLEHKDDIKRIKR